MEYWLSKVTIGARWVNPLKGLDALQVKECMSQSESGSLLPKRKRAGQNQVENQGTLWKMVRHVISNVSTSSHSVTCALILEEARLSSN